MTPSMIDTRANEHFPDKLLWEHTEDVRFGFYFNLSSWSFGKLNDDGCVIDAKKIEDPGLKYLIPLAFEKRILDPIQLSVDMYPDRVSICAVTEGKGNKSAVIPTLFLDYRNRAGNIVDEFKNFWLTSKQHELISRWEQVKIQERSFLNIRSKYQVIALRFEPGNDKKPNLEMSVRSSCYTNLKSYLTGAVRFCHCLAEHKSHESYVFFQRPPWRLVGSIKNLAKLISALAPIEEVDTMFQAILGVCENEKRRNIGIIGPPSSGKETVARVVQFGKSYLHARDKYASLSLAGLSQTDALQQLFGFLGPRGIEKGILDKLEGGTLFIDEVGKTLPAVRSALLRLLETGEYVPLGSSERLKVEDLLFICASTPDDVRNKGKDPSDFWTRVRPFVNVPDVLSKGAKTNLILSCWWRICESGLNVEALRTGRYRTLTPEYIQCSQQFKEWVGGVDDPNASLLFAYHIGTQLVHKMNEFIKATDKCKSPREIINTLGAKFGECVVRNS